MEPGSLASIFKFFGKIAIRTENFNEAYALLAKGQYVTTAGVALEDHHKRAPVPTRPRPLLLLVGAGTGQIRISHFHLSLVWLSLNMEQQPRP